MWFKNIKVFQFNRPFEINEQTLNEKLESMKFRKCGSQEISSIGFTSPFPGRTSLFHKIENKYWFILKKQERLLPAAVVKNELEEKVMYLEKESGLPIGKKRQKELKEDIVSTLLPKAFTKNSFTHGFICQNSQIVVVDAASNGAAEAWLAALRKVLNTLPVVPAMKDPLEEKLTDWVLNGTPEKIELLNEAEFKSRDEEGTFVKCKSCDLNSDEVMAHLKAGLVCCKLALKWQDKVSFLMSDDFSIKRIKFDDLIKDQTQDIPKEDSDAKSDADFSIMSMELTLMIKELKDLLKLDG